MTIEALGAAELCNVYGSTETYGNCAVTDADDQLALRLHSQGLPLPGMTIRAVDPVTRRPLPQGEIGELAVRGYITPGYYRAPELDAEAFDRDGYFLTGDLGTVEADGRIRFRGRLKEMIKTGGVNVAPLEVEHVLLQHRAGLCRGRPGSVEGRDRRRRGRVAARGSNRSRGDRRLLPRAAGKL
jgi:fatty-acyl-CoA synthase